MSTMTSNFEVGCGNKTITIGENSTDDRVLNFITDEREGYVSQYIITEAVNSDVTVAGTYVIPQGGIMITRLTGTPQASPSSQGLPYNNLTTDRIIITDYLVNGKGVITFKGIAAFSGKNGAEHYDAVNDLLENLVGKSTELYAVSINPVNVSANSKYTGSFLSENLTLKGAATVMAGEGNDYIAGSSGNDIIHGEEGNDNVNGGKGNDIIFGGKGENQILGGDGNDTIIGGTLNGEVAYDEAGNIDIENTNIIWNTNNDNLNLGKGSDTVYAGNGDDTITAASFNSTDNNLIYANGGNDTIIVSGVSGNVINTVYGGSGNDTFVVNGMYGSEIFADINSEDTLTHRIQTDAEYTYARNGQDLIITQTKGSNVQTMTLKDHFTKLATSTQLDKFYITNSNNEIQEDLSLLENATVNVTVENGTTYSTTAYKENITVKQGENQTVIVLDSNSQINNITGLSANDRVKFLNKDFSDLTFEKDGNNLKISYSETDKAIINGFFEEGATFDSIVTNEGTKSILSEAEIKTIASDGKIYNANKYSEIIEIEGNATISGVSNKDTIKLPENATDITCTESEDTLTVFYNLEETQKKVTISDYTGVILDIKDNAVLTGLTNKNAIKINSDNISYEQGGIGSESDLIIKYLSNSNEETKTVTIKNYLNADTGLPAALQGNNLKLKLGENTAKELIVNQFASVAQETVIVNNENQEIITSNNDDTVSITGTGNNSVQGGTGSNTITISGADETSENIITVTGTSLDDSDPANIVPASVQTISVDGGKNTITVENGKAEITTGAGENIVNVETVEDNVIKLGSGTDNVTTGDGNNTIEMKEGVLSANDKTLTVGNGTNIITVEKTSVNTTNTITAGSGENTIKVINSRATTNINITGAEDKTQTIELGGGTTNVVIDEGIADITTGGGTHTIDTSSSSQASIIKTTTGKNTITTGIASDTIVTGSGEDVVNTGDGDDLIIIHSDSKKNTITGGKGSDTFRFLSDTNPTIQPPSPQLMMMFKRTTGANVTTITDATSIDSLDLDVKFSAITFQRGTDSDIEFNDLLIGYNDGNNNQEIILKDFFTKNNPVNIINALNEDNNPFEFSIRDYATITVTLADNDVFEADMRYNEIITVEDNGSASVFGLNKAKDSISLPDGVLSRAGNGTELKISDGNKSIIVTDFFATEEELKINDKPVSYIDIIQTDTPETVIDATEINKTKIYGTSESEAIIGSNKNNKIYGGGGNDVIYAWSGNNKIYTNSRNTEEQIDKATVYSGTGNDTITTGNGEDTIIINKGHGNDTVIANSTGTTILDYKNAGILSFKESGSNLIITNTYDVSDINEKLFVSENLTVKNYLKNTLTENIIINTANGKENLYDYITAQQALDTDTVTLGDSEKRKKQNLNGSFLNETIRGGLKNDKITTGKGIDIVIAGKGNDKIYGFVASVAETDDEDNIIGYKKDYVDEEGKNAKTYKFNISYETDESGEIIEASGRGDGADTIYNAKASDKIIFNVADINEADYLKDNIKFVRKENNLEIQYNSYKNGKKTVTDKITLINYFKLNEDQALNTIEFNIADGSETPDIDIKKQVMHYTGKKKIHDTYLDDIIQGSNKNDNYNISKGGNDKVLDNKGNDTYTINLNNVNSVKIDDRKGKDTLILKEADEIIFGVNIGLDENNNGIIYNDNLLLFGYNEEADDYQKGYVVIDNYFATGLEEGVITLDKGGIGTIEKFKTEQTEITSFDFSLINNIRVDVEQFLKDNDYTNTIEVLTEEKAEGDIQALVAIYQNAASI